MNAIMYVGTMKIGAGANVAENKLIVYNFAIPSLGSTDTCISSNVNYNVRIYFSLHLGCTYVIRRSIVSTKTTCLYSKDGRNEQKRMIDNLYYNTPEKSMCLFFLLSVCEICPLQVLCVLHNCCGHCRGYGFGSVLCFLFVWCRY